MAAAITFDLNGNPVTVDASAVRLVKQSMPWLSTEYFIYFMRFQYYDGTNYYHMTIQLNTQNVTATTYDLSNQAGMTTTDQIKDSNSLDVSTSREYSRPYAMDPAFTLTLSSVAGNLADGTFSGDMHYCDAPPTMDPTTGTITLPTPIATIAITNGVINAIPIEV